MIRFKADLVGGLGPRHFTTETRKFLAGAIRAGVEAATIGLKTQFRDQIQGVGLGTRLSNAVGSAMYPRDRKATLHPAGEVYPRGKLAAKIFDALNEGVPIRARNTRYLAIPTRAAWLGGQGGKRPTPREFVRRTGIHLFATESRRPGVLLLRGRKMRERVKGQRTTVVYFILVPQVRPGPHLTFDAFAKQWADRIPSFIERASPEG